MSGKGGKKRKPDIILYSEADDQRAGAEAAKEVPQAIGLVEDPALTRYVARVGARLASFAAAVLELARGTRRARRSRRPSDDGAHAAFGSVRRAAEAEPVGCAIRARRGRHVVLVLAGRAALAPALPGVCLRARHARGAP